MALSSFCWDIGSGVMGVLGKDLFDIGRPRTHVKVQFRQNAYWVERDPTPHPYGETLTKLLNYDVAPYEHTRSVLPQAMEEKVAIAERLRKELNRA